MRKSQSPHSNDPFARNLRAAIAEKGMTQFDLAFKVGLHLSAISCYCTGLHFPRPDKIRKMADALDVPAYKLLEGVLL